MECVNFYVSLPVLSYSKLENSSKKTKLTRNEIINNAIRLYLSNDKPLRPQKNARFSNLYNKNYKG